MEKYNNQRCVNSVFSLHEQCSKQTRTRCVVDNQYANR